jgi:hypothetical protein
MNVIKFAIDISKYKQCLQHNLLIKHEAGVDFFSPWRKSP